MLQKLKDTIPKIENGLNKTTNELVNTGNWELLNQIDWFDLLKWVSFAINLFIIFKWLRRKIILSRFIEGRWEGALISNQENPVKLDCKLLITSSTERANKGFFYYEQIQSENITVRGVDALNDYETNNLFCFNGIWKASFIREFHVAYDKEMKGKQIDAREVVQYKWECKVCSIFTKPKIKTKLTGNGVEFEGTLHKS